MENTRKLNAFIVAWGLALLFYVLEYATRSAPAVMLPELTNAFGETSAGVGALLGAYYYTYSTTSLIAGLALDKAGAKIVVPLGCALLAIGCLLFTVGDLPWGYVGRLLQGAGSSFAFTGAVYLASRGFSARSLATAIGVTQSLGMIGGFAGQFVVGPIIGFGIDWRTIWISFGVIGLVLAGLLYGVVPGRGETGSRGESPSLRALLVPYRIVLSNPQSYLCGAIAGLLFAPTTIGDMTWGVSFFQHDKQFSFQQAVTVIAAVPLGWAVGCPLLGWLADFFGLRKPSLFGGILLMLAAVAQLTFLPELAPPLLSLFIFGIASGAAMIPYTIIKEANPDEVKGSATGIQNFIVFGISAVVGPIFGGFFGSTLETASDHVAHFRDAGAFWFACIACAAILSMFLRETGHRSAPNINAKAGAQAPT
jgi:MFS family permease